MQGMKVLISENNGEWRRLGTSIRYFKMSIDSERVTYAMEFIYELEKPNIEYRFCYGYPYTYSDLENYLNKMFETPIYRKYTHSYALEFCRKLFCARVFWVIMSSCSTSLIGLR